MRNYWMFYAVSMQEFIAYRLSLIFEFLGLLIKTLLVFSFWSVFVKNGNHVGFESNNEVLGYMVVAAILPTIISSEAGVNLGKRILSGDIATDLIKPYNTIVMLSVKSLFFNIFKFILFFIPIVTLYNYLGLISVKPQNIPLFIVSISLATLTMLLLYLFIGMISFWTENWWGIKILFDGIITFFSGAIIPITLFPKWLQSLNSFLPFQYTIFLPSKLLITESGAEFWMAILPQLVWIFVLVVIFYFTWRFALRRLVIFGG
ncbi:TPA: ABC-2 family transporter protein [Bacillus toyonensis]|uniref:ABC transporter permease n=1 Tax=Bacillus cereus group sp. BceL062 TaxID=3445166 RepID=UPI00321DB7B6|nr:ABC-2 family transporter protein [Bacillus toyonensis]